MAGTALAAGILTVTATLSVGLVALGGAAVTAQRTAGAADAAALAAADAASGAIVTDQDPCALAARIATTADATVISCEVHGLTATVQVRSSYAGVFAVSDARAGPREGWR